MLRASAGVRRRRRVGAIAVGVLLACAACTTPTPQEPQRSGAALGDQRHDGLMLAQQRGSGQAKRYGTAMAHDACTLLPLSAVIDNGFRLEPSNDVFKTYLARDVPPEQAVPQNLGRPALSECLYHVVGGGAGDDPDDGVIALDIMQSPFNDESVLKEQAELPRVRAEEYTEQGFEVYLELERSGAKIGYLATIVGPQFVASVQLRGMVDAEKAKALAKKLTSAVTAGLAKPGNPASVFAYEHVYATAPRQCELFTGAEAKQLFGIADSGVVRAELSPQERPDGADTHFVRTNCTYTAAERLDDDDSTNQTFELSTKTYRTADMAKKVDEEERDSQSARNRQVKATATAVDAKAGDGKAFLTRTAGGEARLNFRKGRTRVVLGLPSRSGTLVTDEELTRRLAPVAEQIANRLP